MTKIRNNKQKKDERRTPARHREQALSGEAGGSNAQHRTSNVGVASLRVFNKIETPRAYHNSTLDVRFLIRFWPLFGICDLEFETCPLVPCNGRRVYLKFGAWNL